MPRVYLSLGANIKGAWGTPDQTIARAIEELLQAGVRPVSRSSTYRTAPLGGGMQARYLNLVMMAITTALPNTLIHKCKTIETEAGRGYGRRWGPRPLDIDVLDYRGYLVGWPLRRGKRPRLVLPHPELHLRSFVLVPLAEIAPNWRHPVFGLSASQLLRRLPHQGARGIGVKRLAA